MKFKTTWRLFIAVCLLAGLVWLVEKKWNYGKPEGGGVLPFPAEDVESLVVKWGDSSAECSKKADTWFIVDPVVAPANEGQIDRILTVVEGLRAEETITASDRKERKLTLADYGFDEPRATLTFRGSLGQCTVLVGDDAPLGDLLYVKLEKSGDIVAVSGEIFESVPGTLEDLRERMVVRGDVARTTRLEISRRGGGFIQLVKAGEVWMMHQPVAARADTGQLSSLLMKLFSVEVLDFVWDAAVSGPSGGSPIDEATDANARYEAYQLSADEAVLRVRVWIGDDEIGREVFLGKQKEDAEDRVFARRTGINSVYTVSKTFLDDLLATGVSELRDKRLFFIKPAEVCSLCFQQGDHKLALESKKGEGWMISEPVNWKADDLVVREAIRRILGLRWSGFADGSRTNHADLGLSPPACIVEVRTGGADDEKAAARLWIGKAREDEENLVARFEADPFKFGEEGFVFEIPAEETVELVRDAADPLVFKDRTILALDPSAIKRISLLKHEKEQTVTRNDAGMWMAQDGVEGRADDETISGILYVLAHLRAIRIESHNPQNLSAFGLDSPAVVLTLGLTGSEAIQKSIVMGFRSKTDGIYSMVQGQDVVFVLDNKVVEQLTADVVKPR